MRVLKGPGADRPGLLVSVRSAEEARAAVEGGASVVDVKEPNHGPLGRASRSTWREVRAAVPDSIPVSVALGELRDWENGDVLKTKDFNGIAYRKLGLAGAGPNWKRLWDVIRRSESSETRWVAVAYADWQSTDSPDPTEVLEAALQADDCPGLLVDTFDKTNPSSLSLSPFWVNWVTSAQRSGKFVALAGGLDFASIRQLAPLRPDLFAVRGAACDQANRRSAVRGDLVAELVQMIQDSSRNLS